MTIAAAGRERLTGRDWLGIFAVWFVVAAIMMWMSRPMLGERAWPDPDDAMRLLEVRDWIAGQSWFDVTQYRLNPPDGGPMHWSRLVDVPIAAVILLFRPVVGQYNAETAALIIVPLATLAIALVLVHGIALRLMNRPAALLAVIATPGTLGALKQMRIMRIDHHGWQIVVALVAMLGVLDPRPRRAGIIAGVAMAVWLNISLEGLPFTAAVGVWFGIEWLRDRVHSERLKTYLLALSAASVLLFAGTHAPATWASYPHDAINPAHLAGFIVAAVCCQFAMRREVPVLWHRFGLLSLAALFAVAGVFAVDPYFLQAPFAALDPIVRDLWYNAVDEGQPLWKLSPTLAAQALAQPLVGLAGALLAIRTCPLERRESWYAYTWLLLAGTILSVCVVREATTVSVLSAPATAYLCYFALLRARNLPVMPVRAVATAGALCIMTPAYALPTAIAKEDPRFVQAMKATDSCVTRVQLKQLATLPPSNIAAPMDITPQILAMTDHRAIASGYHRNVSGIHDTILLYVADLDRARAIIDRRKIRYVLFCPMTPESQWWARHGLNGLSAMLNTGRAPDWLERVQIDRVNVLQVWRVRDRATAHG